MARITIEQDGITRVFEGAITDLNDPADFVSSQSQGGKLHHMRTGEGTVSVSMAFINGPRDDWFDENSGDG